MCSCSPNPAALEPRLASSEKVRATLCGLRVLLLGGARHRFCGWVPSLSRTHPVALAAELCLGLRGGLQPAVLRGRLHLQRWLRLREGPSGTAQDPRLEVRDPTTSSPRSFARRWKQGLRDLGIARSLIQSLNLVRTFTDEHNTYGLQRLFGTSSTVILGKLGQREWDVGIEKEDASTWCCLRESR